MNWLTRHWYRHRLRHSPYRDLFLPPDSSTLISLDCETTSLDPHRAELVTIAATPIKGNRILTSHALTLTLAAPESLNAGSVRIHKLRHQDLAHGVSAAQAITALVDFIGNYPLVGYHIRYDKSILDRYARQYLGFPLPNPLIEVSDIYQRKLERLLPNAYHDISIEAISRHLDIPLPARHDALDDALAAALIYVRLTQGEMPMLQSK
ncbi:3'-5' exonuclease [Salinivibrio sharmensis]|uniref:DNA polymerase III subunit epsilon n=1 Tax=Salinivibrio sharmensis TaxID=390883 RepID=A0ABX3KBV7_9GAMM|nr:3'-5' exonuclease [Salinivibrio sharmensis]OOE86258.1 DNA polymerase III subunit epsilon [Salinivibrio sharmensis]